MTKKVLVPLADGFEEIEAVTIIDVLRRAGVEVVSAGLGSGVARGAHGIELAPDKSLDDVQAGEFDMVVLPGGMPGAEHLRKDERVQEILRTMKQEGRWTAAICAAPIALQPAGVSEGRTVTSYPGFGDRVGGATYVEKRVVVDGHLVTSRGPGTALEFALTLVESLVGGEMARKLEQAMLVERAEDAYVAG